MRYSQIPVQTHRHNPANARSPGAALLVRAGYVSHRGELLPLGNRVIERLKRCCTAPDFFARLGLPVLDGKEETCYFPHSTGPTEVLRCPGCGYVCGRAQAIARKTALCTEAALPLEKVETPGCSSIESLARLLGVPEARTAKALMFVREADGQFIFAVIRGDMTLSESKLEGCVGKVRLAREEEIREVGAVAGYASPVGVSKALVVADELIPQSPNLVAGANELGYHLKNVNWGRDFTGHLVADLTLAGPGDPCITCRNALRSENAFALSSPGTAGATFDFEHILFALAETHRDENGLTFPACAAPFDLYLMQVQGKTRDTRPAAENLYSSLTDAGFAVLFDDRDERAGVKFNDADLIGCPVRVTVGERGLSNGTVELKWRQAAEIVPVPLTELVSRVQAALSKG